MNIGKDEMKFYYISESCLKCEGLIRNQEVELIGSGVIINYEYNGKYVFNGLSDLYSHKFFHKKKIVLLESMNSLDIKGVYDLAQSYYLSGEYEKAGKLLEASEDKDDYSELLLLLGKIYFHSDNLEAAKECLLKSLRINEDHAETYRILGEVYQAENSLINSVYYFNQAIEHFDLDEYDKPNDNFPQYSYLGLAVVYFKLNQHDEVIKSAEKFLESQYSWDDLIEMVHEQRAGEKNYIGFDGFFACAIIYELMALSFLEKENLTLAELYIDRAQELDPKSANIAMTKGIIIGRKHNEGEVSGYKEQISLLKQSVELRASSINKLKTLRPEEQVKLFTGNEEESVSRFLVGKIFDNLKKIEILSPIVTPSQNKAAEEDRYTDLFKSHMDSNLVDTFGWITHTQSRGGYTREELGNRGGIGERDLVIRSHQNKDLLMGEALILKGKDTASIKTHTQKIFGYDIGNCNFHLIINWGFSKKPDSVWNDYKKLVMSRQDGIYAVIEHGETENLYPGINKQGIRTFYTKHSTDVEQEVATVIHVYVDVLKQMKREGAELARKK
ncbi:tetratricopeptide repeat protein [Bacillus mycoides]|uniref:tetratricopeptide repeat protein n=1 Tax=Bacillus mycoides TaxID=1405 RepID=UPI001F47961F|nr:tetratricopeptide repeat protein [Bacillus mycoides]